LQIGSGELGLSIRAVPIAIKPRLIEDNPIVWF
jgi:hypothetical protein